MGGWTLDNTYEVYQMQQAFVSSHTSYIHDYFIIGFLIKRAHEWSEKGNSISSMHMDC